MQHTPERWLCTKFLSAIQHSAFTHEAHTWETSVRQIHVAVGLPILTPTQAGSGMSERLLCTKCPPQTTTHQILESHPNFACGALVWEMIINQNHSNVGLIFWVGNSTFIHMALIWEASVHQIHVAVNVDSCNTCLQDDLHQIYARIIVMNYYHNFIHLCAKTPKQATFVWYLHIIIIFFFFGDWWMAGQWPASLDRPPLFGITSTYQLTKNCVTPVTLVGD